MCDKNIHNSHWIHSVHKYDRNLMNLVRKFDLLCTYFGTQICMESHHFGAQIWSPFHHFGRHKYGRHFIILVQKYGRHFIILVHKYGSWKVKSKPPKVSIYDVFIRSTLLVYLLSITIFNLSCFKYIYIPFSKLLLRKVDLVYDFFYAFTKFNPL